MTIAASTTITPSEFGSTPRAQSLNAQSVLYSVINLHGRLPTSSFTRNLLLPNSIDFHPIPTRPSDLQISNGSILHPTFIGLQSAGIDRRASCSTIDSKRAHFVPHSKLLRTCRFPFGYGDQLLNLANDQDSLGHFSKRTNRRCSYSLSAYSACTHLVSRSSHPAKFFSSFLTL